MVRIKKNEREQVMGQTRQALLDAAAEEFARQGYLGANINSISLQAGFAKGTVYNYFPSKKALLLALIDTTAQQHLNFIIAQAGKETDPPLRLERFFKAGFDFVAFNLPRARVMLNTVYGSDEELKAYCFQAYQPIFQFLSQEILIPGIQTGVFRSIEPQSTSILLMTIYLGAASQLNEQGQHWLDPGQVTNLILEGLRK
jgi:AcrR family transcriptional regulator